ncbi:unnamed protein product [Pseudo-nitzschia multistriata]|uniref:Hexose transporter 1 n=1 Tax=Pseudo-nitzschia multistriata TaxID=183589 RepID=A0A448ZK48_9STRA|nr:unnamed protein product [Pseudo-nitzschia multistriata]
MASNESTKLLNKQRDADQHNAWNGEETLSNLMTDSSDFARSVRSHTIGKLGGSSSMGNFKVHLGEELTKSLPRSYSATMDGQVANLTPSQMGQQEMYTQVPFVAIPGLQKKEREVASTFANYAADLDVASIRGLSEMDKTIRHASSTMLILDEMEDSKVVTAPLIFTVIIVSASMFLVGHNTSVMNAPEKVVFPGHSITLWALAVAAFAIGGPFGSGMGGKLADKRGRRGAMLIGIWIFLLGGLIQSVGILFADIVAFPFATPSGWRVMFSFTAIIAVGQLLLSPFLLESPRWLLNRDPNSLRARYIIKKLRGLRNEQDVEREVGNFIIGESAQHHEEGHDADTLKEILSHRKRRKLLISCLILQMAQQLSGINAIFFYSTSILEGVIDNPLVGTTIIGAVNVLATYVALLIMDSTGRRSLILWSSGLMFASCIIVVLALKGILSNIFALLAVNLYVFGFEIGLGPIPWLIVAEMFDGKYVTVAMSLCSQLNWACNFIVGMVFPYINAYLGPYSFIPFAIILAMTFLFSLFVLPETQGKTPEDLIAEMVRRNSQSMVYEINADSDAGAINEEWKKAMEQLMEEDQNRMNAGNYDYGFKPIENA